MKKLLATLPLSKDEAKALTLTRLNRKDSPPGQLARQIKQMASKPEQILLNNIKNSLDDLFWHPPEIYNPRTCSFSHGLFDTYAKRERNRLALAAHVVHQVALVCLPRAIVDYDGYEKAYRERALYFRPGLEFVTVDFPVAWEVEPTVLERKFNLPEGDAQHVLSILGDYCATPWKVSFIQVEGLTSPSGPDAPLKWPSPPYHVRPARLAKSFISLLFDRKTRPHTFSEIGLTGQYFIQHSWRIRR